MATLPLLDRMRQDMQLRGLAARTQDTYLEAVESVAAFCGRPPNALDAVTEDELHEDFLHLVRDRTPALGQVHCCDTCGYEHYVYHSCRNRSCAQCHGAATADWLAAREAELLPVPCFHVGFTLPAALRPLVRAHQRVLLATLMTTATDLKPASSSSASSVGSGMYVSSWLQSRPSRPHCAEPGHGRADPRAPRREPGCRDLGDDRTRRAPDE